MDGYGTSPTIGIAMAVLDGNHVKSINGFAKIDDVRESTEWLGTDFTVQNGVQFWAVSNSGQRLTYVSQEFVAQAHALTFESIVSLSDFFARFDSKAELPSHSAALHISFDGLPIDNVIRRGIRRVEPSCRLPRLSFAQSGLPARSGQSFPSIE